MIEKRDRKPCPSLSIQIKNFLPSLPIARPNSYSSGPGLTTFVALY